MHFSTIAITLSLALSAVAAPTPDSITDKIGEALEKAKKATEKAAQDAAMNGVIDTLVKQIDNQPNQWGWLPFTEDKVQPPCPTRTEAIPAIQNFCKNNNPARCSEIAQYGSWGTNVAQYLVNSMYDKENVKRGSDTVATLIRQIDQQPNKWGWLPFDLNKVQPPCPDNREDAIPVITYYCNNMNMAKCEEIAGYGSWGTNVAQYLVNAIYESSSSPSPAGGVAAEALIKQIDNQPNKWGWIPFKLNKVQPPCPDRASSVKLVVSWCTKNAANAIKCRDNAAVGSWGTNVAQRFVDDVFGK